MNRLLCFLSAGILLSSAAAAQEGYKCGTDRRINEIRQANPSVVDRERELEEFTRNFIASSGSRDEQIYIIPIVFHVVHQWGEENISNEQIFDQVAILNRDYRKQNADTIEVVEEFEDIIADCRVEFRLATIDPLGNCTNGIDRIASVESLIGDDGAKLNSWPRSKYLNVWVVKSMEDGVAGYAYYPGVVTDSPMSFADGIAIRHNYVGSIGTANEYRSRALTHEVGLSLNLPHPWGDNNDPGIACGDDFVEDTPETKGWETCVLNGSVCNPGVIENVQNYMDYAYCSRMFTIGQQQRMEAALNSPVSFRTNLWSAANLEATGTDGIHTAQCSPNADFYPDKPIVCVNTEVRFIDNSSQATPTSWSWTFQDATPSTSSEQNPEVTFTSDGWKTVTLTVSNAQGETVFTNTHAVYITPDWAELQGGLLSEEFESQSDFDFYWKVLNLDQNETSWRRINSTGYQDHESAYLNVSDLEPTVIGSRDNDIDELITPSMDLDPLSNGDFTFMYAYSTLAPSPELITERLEIWSSINCGETWVLRKTIEGLDLVTAGSIATPFFPTSDNQWKFYTFDVPSSITTEHVRFKFVFHSSVFSNNIFIDDVNIVGNVGVSEVEAVASLRVFPNPSQGGNVYISYPSALGDPRKLVVYDISGKMVHSQTVVNEMTAENSVTFDSSTLSEGIYTLELKGSKQNFVGRLIVSKR